MGYTDFDFIEHLILHMPPNNSIFIALKHRTTKVWFFVAIGLVVLNWVVAVWKLLPLAQRTDPIALHYSVIMGIDRLGLWYWTFLPAVLGFVYLCLNILFAGRFLIKNRSEIAFAVALHTTILELLFLVGTFLIILLNVGWTL